MKERKVIIIGLDGATWHLIKPWADEGVLPTFVLACLGVARPPEMEGRPLCDLVGL